MELSNRNTLLERAKEIMDNESVNPLEALKKAEKELYKEIRDITEGDCI